LQRNGISTARIQRVKLPRGDCTVDPKHPLYDGNIVKYFRFRTQNGSPKGFANRIQPFLPFYEDLSRCYQRILADGTLANVMQSFRDAYSPRIPDIKILDFIFWSAGSLGLSISIPAAVAGVTPSWAFKSR